MNRSAPPSRRGQPPQRSATATPQRRPADSRRPTTVRITLPTDSLGYALAQAATLVAVVLEGGNLTEAYEQALKANPGWSDATRGAVRDLAWSTLRDYGRGEAVLAQLLKTPPPATIRGLLLVALHRLEQRPEQAHTIVDQAVEAGSALMPGLKAMVNAVLRNVLRQADAVRSWREADEAARYRHPAWWVARLRAQLPAQWEAVLAAGNLPPPMALRINRRRAGVEEVAAALAGAGIDAVRQGDDGLLLAQPCAVARLPGFADGRVSVQDLGAQWAARLLDARDGERVLDACAAPGGKTAHMLERADLDLLALDHDTQRATRIDSNLARLGLAAKVAVADCRDVDRWWDARHFDRILADVPCSASGVVRRHPDIKWLRRRDDIARFAAQQAEILDALWRTLRPGGTMLYATCSVFDEENRAQIDRFCQRHADAERLPIDGNPDLSLLPTAEHDGFFYSLLRKAA